MQLDLHYYCTAVLAATAGFAQDEALTMAYACQYADDAQDDEVLNVSGVRFTPVRTAHYGLKMLTAREDADIHLPFHFLPPGQVSGGMADYRAVADGALAHGLVRLAGQESEALLRLCRLGLALHTYEDTWSHANFSAWLDKGNDVDDIHVQEGGTWRPLGRLESLGLDLLPCMGHFQAGFLPDEPYRVWNYLRPQDKQRIDRDNPSIYLAAVDAVYARLRECRGGAAPGGWPEVRAKIEALLPQGGPDRQGRAELWQAAFPELFAGGGDYDPDRWRDQALRPVDSGPPDPDLPQERDILVKQWEWTSPDPQTLPWVNFHRAALIQRELAQGGVFFPDGVV